MRFGNWIFVGLVGFGLATTEPCQSCLAQDPNQETASQETASQETANQETASQETEIPAATDEAVAEAADEVADEMAADATDHEAPEGTGRKAYDEAFINWKKLLNELRDLKAAFRLAEESELGALRQDWTNKLAEGEAMVPKLRETGLSAYLEAPNQDRELSRFLIKLAADLIRQDDYSTAKEVLLKLQENGCDERGIDNLLGISSFGTNDFELAEKFLTEAQRKGALSEQGEKFFLGLNDVITGWEREVKLREEEAAAEEKLPRVQFETTAGNVTFELFENEAPETVGNFVSLIEKGFYDGLSFHRVLEGFMAQGGCPLGDGTGGPGYRIYCECINDDHRNHFAGSLSMAKETARHTGGSQFFVCFVPAPNLDGRHTVFGRVVEGMDVLPKISKIDPEARRAQDEPTMITKATVLNKRDHEYRPNKVK